QKKDKKDKFYGLF
uniref:Tachykinin-like peptide-XII n=1 Tax=Phoneutria nigriventer TaxID=6918 RepID=TLP12_PHONI|nr:RecName: Full=Tachykinin-like peptide-XII; AltName: Full=P.nigriventer tachykinin peptides XII; Short=PnTkP-XII; AltName: Full=U29-ctenitoxin-Pn1l; Short=U29-CNTX-Pn1l [Phoneutria nigriventer]